MARRTKERDEGHFTLKQKTLFKDMESGKVKELPESDLCFQDDKAVYQYTYKSTDKERTEIVKPGIFNMVEVAGAVALKKAELRVNKLLASVGNTKAIIEEADLFFDNIDIYEELGEPKARKLLIHSDPGMGKSATITHYCQHAIEQDEGTVVLVWPTGELESHYVSKFLSKVAKYTKECSRMILIMEDIGGGEREGSGNARAVDSAMLDLLDGLQVTFKLPTFIIATTNYPQNLLSALADRPGRFDKILALTPPPYEEAIALAAFIGKRDLTDEDKQAFKTNGAELFSIAHIKEVVIRSRLNRCAMEKTIKELIKHKDLFKNAFEGAKKGVGFGSSRRDDTFFDD